MYKTVRHGENSLQYKILAQQEEGITNVRCRRSRKGRTAVIITIILLLVCGVIASAVLVPLILTNDFITLTGTFQKFSVSTLRRTHSGNHVVVIAKKPHGWNSSRHGVLPTPAPTPNASLNRSSVNSKESGTGRGEGVGHTSTPSTPGAVALEKEARGTTQKLPPPPHVELDGLALKVTSTPHPVGNLENVVKTESGIKEQHVGDEKAGQVQNIVSTTQNPLWRKAHTWSFQSPSSFVNWTKNRVFSHPLATALGVFFAVSFLLILIVVLMKSFPDRKNTSQKESADMKEDKARLLKPSSRGSDEE